MGRRGFQEICSSRARLWPQTERLKAALYLNETSGGDDAYLAHAQSTLELPLGPGLGEVKGKIFRIGHLGSLNELELLGALAGVEMTLTSFGVALPLGAGLAAAETYLLQTAPGGPGQGR